MTIRTFAFVADTHADEHKRFDEHNQTMHWIADDAHERGARGLIHAGDVYERSSTPREREAVTDIVRHMGDRFPLVIVPGNHDDWRDIEALGKLRTRYQVHAHSRPGPITTLPDLHGDAQAWVAVLPWPRKAYLLAGAELSRADGDAAAVLALKNILRGYGASFAGHAVTGAPFTVPRLFAGHCMMRGSKLSVSQPPRVGMEFELSLEDLALVGADFYAIGHIHLGQDWRINAGAMEQPTVAQVGPFVEEGAPVVYPGSPSPKNWGEIEPKSYVVATFDGPRLLSWERIPTPVRKLVHRNASFIPALTQGFDSEQQSPALGLDGDGAIPAGADVRLRYECRPEDRDVARALAENVAATWRMNGAANVELEPVILVEQRARAPEVAAAVTNADRLVAYWKAMRMEPTNQDALLAKLEIIEAEVTASSGAPKMGALRFRSMRVKGMGNFVEERVFSFEDLEGDLTAVTGPNGAGKSTLLELLVGAVYGDCPTRGSLLDLAVGRDAFVEIDVETGGHHYRIRQLVDAISRKREAVITCDDVPCVDSTKVSAVAAYVDKHFPDPEVLYVSTFIAQQSKGFLAQKPSDRKSLLLKVRGVDKLEELASAARKHATSEAAHRTVLEARLADERARAGDVAKIDAELLDAADRLAGGESGLELAKAAAADGTLRQQESLDRYREVEAVNAARNRVQADAARARDKLGGIRQRRAALQGTLKRAGVIRAAVKRCEEIDQRRRELHLVSVQLVGETKTNAEARRQQEQLMGQAKRKATAASATLVEAPKCREALVEIPRGEAYLTEHNATLQALSDELAKLMGTRLGGVEDRIRALRKGLEEIRDTEWISHDGPCNFARQTLVADDETSAAATEVPRRIKAVEEGIKTEAMAIRTAEVALARCRDRAAKVPLMDRAQADLDAANAAHEEAAKVIDDLSTALASIDDRAAVNTKAMAVLTTERDGLTRDACDSTALERAEATLAELTPQETEASAEIARAQAELEAIGPVPDLLPVPDMAKLSGDVDAAAKRVRQYASEIPKLEAALVTAKASEERIGKLVVEKDGADVEVSEWQLLTIDLGKDRLQAAISDAALPELVALTNSLLHSAFGARFTVDVRSQAADAKGKRMLETLDVWVIDTVHGREALAETYSGGEVAIIGEGLSLALTTLACRTSGATRPTLVRDEAGAALDPVNGRAWIAMLRRAVEMMGADRLLFVSHAGEVSALADSRIEL